MKKRTILGCPYRGLAILLALLGGSTGAAFAQSPVKLQGSGAITISAGGTARLALKGTASHLGRYTCSGELTFLPGPTPGTFNGSGVAVFRAANGDLLVGVVSCQLSPSGIGGLAFQWRDSVRFSDGTTVSDTGRFVSSRPPGALTPFRYVATPARPDTPQIIAILIG